MFSTFEPFNGKSDFGKGLPPFLSSFFLGKGLVTLFGAAPSFCVAKRCLRTSIALSSFSTSLHTSVENSLFLHNASSSFRTGSFSPVLFVLFASAVFCGISFLSSRRVFTGHHFIVFSSFLHLTFFFIYERRKEKRNVLCLSFTCTSLHHS